MKIYSDCQLPLKLDFDNIRSKKSKVFSRSWPGKKKFYHSPIRIVECVSIYTFLISKSNKQQKQQESKKPKETKEEKRISPENRLKK